MSHEVDTMFARDTPWHELGNITNRNLTAREALVEGGLDWEVTKQPIFALTEDGFTQIEDKVATVRSSDQSVLGVVGNSYEPIQNVQMLDWAQMLLDTGEAQFVSAGSLRNGKVVFACLEIGDEINLAGGPYVIKPYFITASSHDASLAFKGLTSPTCVVCMNTLQAAQVNSITSWTIRHTTSADFRLEQARRVLGLVYSAYDAFGKEVAQLLNTPHSEDQFDEMIPKLIKMPKEPTPRIEQNVTVERNKVRGFYYSNTIKPFRGTAWGSLNAFNEFELWGKKVKGDRAERHALRTLNADFPLTEKARKLLEVAA